MLSDFVSCMHGSLNGGRTILTSSSWARPYAGRSMTPQHAARRWTTVDRASRRSIHHRRHHPVLAPTRSGGGERTGRSGPRLEGHRRSPWLPSAVRVPGVVIQQDRDLPPHVSRCADVYADARGCPTTFRDPSPSRRQGAGRVRRQARGAPPRRVLEQPPPDGRGHATAAASRAGADPRARRTGRGRPPRQPWLGGDLEAVRCAFRPGRWPGDGARNAGSRTWLRVLDAGRPAAPGERRGDT